MTYRILSIGEVLWDLLPSGRVLGGAPANFAVHALAMGAQGRLLSRVGSDALGTEILSRLSSRGMDTSLIQIDSTLATGTVAVNLDQGGQPHYTIHENVAWDALAFAQAGREAAAVADAVCFGTLGQRSAASREAIQRSVAASPPQALRVFDINLRQSFYSRQIIETSLGLANILKLNEAELPVLAEMFALAGSTREQMAQLADRFQLRAVAFTRGERGSCLLVNQEFSDHPGTPTVVQDAVGAGDAFTAALVMGLLAGWPLQIIHDRAIQLATYVCSQIGPTPMLPDRMMRQALRR
jgi:fructokinase